MKKLSLLLCICAMAMASFAQLPNGSYAPAFTGYEIDKTTGNIITTDPIVLYDLTNAGYAVYMDVFATWCGPCWNFHNSGALENLYAQYGPEGANDVRVLAIEGSNGNYASLSGTGADAGGSASQGNWLNGVDYPVIPLRMSPNTTAFDNDYAIGYFPTVYMVCPKSRLVYEVGQAPAGASSYYTGAQLHELATTTCPQFDFTLANNAFLLARGATDLAHCAYNPTVEMENVGTATMTSAVLNVEFNGQSTPYNWTGNLEPYAKTTVTLPQIVPAADGTYNFSVTISQVNGVNDADATMNTVSGEVVFFLAPTSSALEEDFNSGMPTTWSNPDGLLSIKNAGTQHGKAVRFEAYNISSGEIGELYLPFEDLSAMSTPVLGFDVAHRRYSSSYSDKLRVKYSKDCGASWTTIYDKSGSTLASVTGNTTSSFTPTDDQWRHEVLELSNISDRDDLIIKFEFVSGYGNNIWIDNVVVANGTGISQNVESGVTVYPNPATDVLNISTADEVQRVEIFNMQGQLVKVETGDVNTVSVKELANGMYTVKLTTVNGTSMHKIVKK